MLPKKINLDPFFISCVPCLLLTDEYCGVWDINFFQLLKEGVILARPQFALVFSLHTFFSHSSHDNLFLALYSL